MMLGLSIYLKLFVLTLYTHTCIIVSMIKHTNTTMRFNITLPADIGMRVKTSQNYSAVITESLRQKFAHEDQERLAKILAEGYKSRANRDKSLVKEFDHTLRDGL